MKYIQCRHPGVDDSRNRRQYSLHTMRNKKCNGFRQDSIPQVITTGSVAEPTKQTRLLSDRREKKGYTYTAVQQGLDLLSNTI